MKLRTQVIVAIAVLYVVIAIAMTAKPATSQVSSCPICKSMGIVTDVPRDRSEDQSSDAYVSGIKNGTLRYSCTDDQKRVAILRGDVGALARCQ